MSEHLQRRFQDFLSLLSEGGPRLARLHSDARFLGEPGQDPDVERLLEGVAFLCSAIEDVRVSRLPIVTQLLFDLFFPDYLRPLPSATIAMFESKRLCKIPRGTEVRSRPIGGSTCRFRSVYDVWTGPLEVAGCAWRGAGTHATFSLVFHHATADAVPPDGVLLYLNGDPSIVRTLHYKLLTGGARIAKVRADGSHVDVPMLELEPVGYSPSEGLFGQDQGTRRLQLLQEYFALPEKFLFLRLKGLRELVETMGPERMTDDSPGRLELVFELRVDAFKPLPITKNNVCLGATPLANLFETTSDPVRLRPGQTEVEIGIVAPPDHLDIFSITRIRGLGGTARSEEWAYPVIGRTGIAASERFAQLQQRRNNRLFVRLCESDPMLRPADITIVADIVCTNASLPQRLLPGDLSIIEQAVDLFDHGDPALASLRCRDIHSVSPATSAPEGADAKNRLLSQLSLAERRLADLGALTVALDLYNFLLLEDRLAAERQQVMVEGLRRLVRQPASARVGKDVVWGEQVILEVAEDFLGGEAERFLFGSALNEILAADAEINRFVEFGIRSIETQRTIWWPKRAGLMILDS